MGMKTALISVVVAASLAAGSVLAASGSSGSTNGGACAKYHPPFPGPSHFVRTVDNAYFPLPVGRTLVYRGVEDGEKEVDRVTVTDRTKVIEGVTATVVNDELRKRNGRLLEKTFDYYAQDDRGNVWYLGEDTKEFFPNGEVDTSGSWQAGVDGGKPGIIMENNPQVPDAYRQECLSGEAEDMAWVVGRGGSVDVPLRTVHHVLRTLEFSPLEPSVVDRKLYGPGLGIVFERTLAGGQEVFRLVRVGG